MKLRLRFALTTVAVVVPAIAGLAWMQASLRDRAGEEWLAALSLSFLQSGGRAQCEADPAAWVGRPRDEPRPSPMVYAYDESFARKNPEAPLADPSLVADVRGGRPWAARRVSLAFGRVVDVLIRTPWHEGPCAYVLVRAPSGPAVFGLQPPKVWLAPVLFILAAMLVAVGPVVHRIRKLTESVRRSARAHYADPIADEGTDEIAELARAFDEAGREVRAQLAEKEKRELAMREFVANTTHDVMTPLTVLHGHLTAFAARAASGEPLDPGHVSAAMTEAHYMTSLLHNLAIAAKLEAGEATAIRAPVDLNALVARVIGRHALIAERLHVSLDSAVPEEPIAIVGDVTLLEQAVSNVVHNAIRYNRPGGHVAVILERDGGAFRLSVTDDGPGIPAADLSRIAGRGYRGDAARTRAPEGQGLGLDIAFRVARLHALTLDLGPSEFGGLRATLRGALDAPAPST
jgi:signal transduction histidine kinase